EQKLSLVGWSLGGIYARELARRFPADVRQVITLASPFRAPSASSVARFYPRRRSQARPAPRPPLHAPLPLPPRPLHSPRAGVAAALFGLARVSHVCRRHAESKQTMGFRRFTFRGVTKCATNGTSSGPP